MSQEANIYTARFQALGREFLRDAIKGARSTGLSYDDILQEVRDQKHMEWEREDASESQETLTWIPLKDAGQFYQIRLRIAGRPLDADHIQKASGCLGYALKEVVRGEELSEPTSVRYEDENGACETVITYDYDSTKSRSDDPDYALAAEKIRQYIQKGTPIRETDRAGQGTKGTRLVEGLGIRYLDIDIEVAG